MKTRYLLPCMLALALLVFAARWGYFYRGSYRSPQIPTLDPAQLELAGASYHAVEEELAQAGGHVLIDVTHASNLAVNDLAPLWVRLEARDVKVETLDNPDDSLAARLHGATALLILAPTRAYTPQEREEIVAFVEDGGRLLLAADPTRPVLSGDSQAEYEPDLIAALFPESAVPAINSIANAFSVVYFDDYLYNLYDNAGNYRNVKLAHTGQAHALTNGLETVVFYAAHSLRSKGQALLSGDENTRSSVRTGETSLATAVLAGQENVLALGDVTFLTAPYHATADNDRFLSNIADWLAVDSRQRDELEDFPYLFDRPVDLVQVSGERLDPQIIVNTAAWQEAFEQAGLALELRWEPAPRHDALLLGVYDDLDRVQDILSRSGVTVTVELSKTDAAPGTAAPEPTAVASVDVVTPTPTPTLVITSLQPTQVSGTIELAGLGTLDLAGTSLFVLDRGGRGDQGRGDERLTILVLTESEPDLVAAVGRLMARDWGGCVQADGVTVCSTGESQEEPAEEEEPGTGEEPSGSSGGRILLVAIDTGDAKVHTGAEELESILKNDYQVDIWSIDEKGPPGASDLQPYGACIFASGDRLATAEDAEIFAGMDAGTKCGVMVIGEQPLPMGMGVEETASVSDLRVVGSDHPLAKGFEPNQVLTLSPLDSPVSTMVIPESSDLDIVFERGPDSPQSGTPALIAGMDETSTSGPIIFATFAFYRLPEDAQRMLALNAAAWLMGK